MLDNKLIAEIITTLNTGLSSLGLSSVKVKQNFQPTSQGTNTDPTIYLSKINDELMGSPLRNDTFDVAEQKEVHTETQQYVTMFQINALSKQDPSDTTQLTASDLVKRASYILQSSAAITYLQSKEIGILKIKSARNPYFINDLDQNEAMPSFDFQVTHKQVIITEVPVISAYEYDVKRV